MDYQNAKTLKSELLKKGYRLETGECEWCGDNEQNKNIYKAVIFLLKITNKEVSYSYVLTQYKFSYEIVGEQEGLICEECIKAGSSGKRWLAFFFGSSADLEGSQFGNNETDAAYLTYFKKRKGKTLKEQTKSRLVTRFELAEMLLHKNNLRASVYYKNLGREIQKLKSEKETAQKQLSLLSLSEKLIFGGNVAYLIAKSLSGPELASVFELTGVKFVGKYVIDAIIDGIDGNQIKPMVDALLDRPEVLKKLTEKLRGEALNKFTSNIPKEILEKLALPVNI